MTQPDEPTERQATGEDEVLAAEPSAWATLRSGLALRPTKAQFLAGVLCALLGFALVVQVKLNQSTDLSGLSQQELVRILDEVTQRTDDLDEQAAELRAQRAELVTGTATQRAAQIAAAARAEAQGILAGRLPAEGPGVAVTLREGSTRLTAAQLVDVLESLRNAGAEAIDLSGRRVTASTYILDTVDGVEVDGVSLTAPYRWLAIGDPDTLRTALEMPGGAMAAIRNVGATTDVAARDVLTIDSVRTLSTPRFATPVPSPTAS
ncbi:DUF881 domain-containing protein [Actinotalea sp.]|uniref:DUF881 domain-containing protein n=1 Tax=Actinotalea sp. TaxID=1872145 RepID=UPI003563F65E